jgi:hypothetical protein
VDQVQPEAGRGFRPRVCVSGNHGAGTMIVALVISPRSSEAIVA